MHSQSKRLIAAVTVGAMLSACASTTEIITSPPGAKVYKGEEMLGQTPYFYSDTDIVGSDVNIKLSKPGYQDLNVSFARDEEVDVPAAVGGVFLVPLLWVMKYKPEHSYQLISLHPDKASQKTGKLAPPRKSNRK